MKLLYNILFLLLPTFFFFGDFEIMPTVERLDSRYVSFAIPGAVGDGVTDDTSAIQTWLNGGGVSGTPAGTEVYRITSALSFTGSGDKTIEWNGASVTATSVRSTGILINQTSGVVTMNNLTVLGNNNIQTGIWMQSGFIFNNVDVQDIYADGTRAIAFRVTIDNASKFTTSSMINCDCDTVRSESDGLINGGLEGISKCLWVTKNVADLTNPITFTDGHWQNVWGDDGDVVAIDENVDAGYESSNQFVFDNIDISNWQRRATKLRASGIEWYNSDFTDTNPSNPNLETSATVGMFVFIIPAADAAAYDTKNHILQGNRFIGNGHEPDNFLSNVNGVQILDNEFINSNWDLEGDVRNVNFSNNKFTGQSIAAPIYQSTGGSVTPNIVNLTLDNNTAIHDAGSGGTWSAFVDLNVNTMIVNGLTLTDNLIITNTGSGDVVYGLLRIGNVTTATVSNITAGNNVVGRQGTNETQQILQINENITGTNSATNNKLLTAGVSSDLIVFTGTGTLTESGNTQHPLSYDYSGLGVGATIGEVAVTGVTVAPSSIQIEVGETRQLSRTLIPDNPTDQSGVWASDTPSEATVNSTGLVTGVSIGSGIQVGYTTTDGGYVSYCIVEVIAAAPDDSIDDITPIQEYRPATLDPAVTVDGNTTSTWNDRSGNNLHATPGGTTVLNNGSTGRQSELNTGWWQVPLTSTNNFAPGTPHTLIFREGDVTPTGIGYGISKAGADGSRQYGITYAGGNPNAYFAWGVSGTFSNVPPGPNRLIILVNDGTQVNAWADGQQIMVNGAVGSDATSGGQVNIGGRSNGAYLVSAGTQFDLAVIEDSAIDNTQRLAIEAEFMVNVESDEIPVITLLGSDPVNITTADTYVDAGATASDAEDGDLSGDIVVGGDEVIEETPGTYVITYNVTDSDLNVATEVTRTVNVSAVNTGTIVTAGASGAPYFMIGGTIYYYPTN